MDPIRAAAAPETTVRPRPEIPPWVLDHGAMVDDTFWMGVGYGADQRQVAVFVDNDALGQSATKRVGSG